MIGNYLRQGLLIFGFSLLGEALHSLIPLPIPAAVYGMILLLLALCLKLVRVEQVKEISTFLLTLLPILFVAPAVNLLESWPVLAPNVLPFVLLVVASTVIVFAVSGLIAQATSKKEDKDAE